MFARILCPLSLLAACTVGPVDEGGEPAPVPILLAADDTPVGTYQDGRLSLDPELVRSLQAPETGAGDVVAIALRVGQHQLAVDPVDPVVAIPEALEPGAELHIVLDIGGATAAEIPLVVGDAADAEAAAYSLCYPNRWVFGHIRSDFCGGACPAWGRYHEFYVITCDSCGNCSYSVDSGICGPC